MSLNLQTTVRLNNNVKMPLFGLGVWKSGEGTVQAVADALDFGYRLIDTAHGYGNEKEVGEGLKMSDVPREDVFVTTKVWTDVMRAGTVYENCMESLRLLDTEYIDLYLVHWPAPLVYVPAYKEVERLYKDGYVKAIGVSNFHEFHFKKLLEEAEFLPTVNQIECHPLLTQEPLIDYMKDIRCVPQAWSPLGGGELLKDETIIEIGKKYGKTAAQVILRWDVQLGISTIPKSTHKDRIIENASIFDFELTLEEMATLSRMNSLTRFGMNPDNFSF
ncbi:aldo/keto reductase [Eubacteriales bacterium OttesenSCG-928-M02]|nr:aldo/keto reductase [Eubacteriales bacterium OttesenSCG-928-M02]